MPEHPKQARSIERKALDFIREENVFRPNERVLLAVSGGPDSTALLLLLLALRDELGINLTGVVHYNHHLRPEAALDAAFVRDLSQRQGIAVFIGEGSVEHYAKMSGQPLEAAARELRYQFFREVAVATGASAVATGHTLDDQAETVLLHLIRGSGLRGLVGMQPRGTWPFPPAATGPALTRPLLGLRKTDAVTYCRLRGLTPREDPTNWSMAFLRNRVRLELLPLLRRYNPQIELALADLARSASADLAVIEDVTRKAFREVGVEEPGRVRLARQPFLALPDSIQRHLLQLAVRTLLGTDTALMARQVQAVLRIARAGPGRRLHLPHGLTAEAGYDHLVLQFAPHPQAPAPAPPLPETMLAVPGITQVSPWRVRVEWVDTWRWEGERWTAYLDPEAVGPRLLVRGRRPGDRFQPLGMQQEKKLQDFFVDAKVPRAEREAVPLLCAIDGRIAWVAGQRVAHWAQARPGHPAWQVQVERTEP